MVCGMNLFVVTEMKELRISYRCYPVMMSMKSGIGRRTLCGKISMNNPNTTYISSSATEFPDLFEQKLVSH
jgi:hypothetical protein